METQRRVRGDTVKHIRSLRNMSMQDVADLNGPTPTTQSNVENASRSEVRPSTLRKLARALDVPVEVFFMEPGEAEETLLGPFGSGQPGDATDALLAVLQDAAAAYDPESGAELEWDTATYREVLAKLADTSQRAAALDFQAGRTDRGLAIMEALIQAVMGLGVRLDRLETRTRKAKAPAGPRLSPIRPELTDARAMNERLKTLSATAA